MTTATPQNVIIDDIVDMNEYFTEIAMGEGLAPLLVLAGTILIAFSIAVFGGLTLGAVANLFTSN